MAPIVRVASEAYLDRLSIFGDFLAEDLFKVATSLSGSLGRKTDRPPGNKVDKMISRLISTIDKKCSSSRNPIFFSLLGLLFEAKN